MKPILLKTAVLALLGVFLLAFSASAFYTIENCPTCGNYTSVVFTTGGTGDLLKDTDYISSASFGWNDGTTNYLNIAEKFIPTKDTRVCVVRSKIQYSPDYGEQQIRLQVSVDSSAPAFSTNSVPNVSTPIIDTVVGGIDPITPPSQQVPAFVWFQFQSCWTARAWHVYWFEFSLRNTGYQQARFVAYQTDFQVSTNHWGYGEVNQNSWVDTGRDWSFEIINDLSQSETEMPPSSASYGFENKDFGLLGNMFRDVIVWLFFPDQANLNRFSDLWDTIKQKPPIGYFTVVKDELGNIGIGSPSINFDTTAAASIINPLRTGLIVILWVMFAFWVFHRLRNLQL